MTLPNPLPDHDGETYDPVLDKVRLNGQQRRVYLAMRDGAWRTLREISELTYDPEASVSARLRDLRKEKFGAFIVERRRRGGTPRGTHEYRLLFPEPGGQLEMFPKEES